MARSRYRFLKEDTAPYFITATTVNWLPLFGNPEIALILLNSLKFLIAHQRLCVFAYVIMENHLHLVATAAELGIEIANFKSFTARESINYYIDHQNDFVLQQLAELKLDHKRDRTYQFWQEGAHPQRIMDMEMMDQKIAYIHDNPVRRGYVDEPEHWRYSSARDYSGRCGLLPIKIDW